MNPTPTWQEEFDETYSSQKGVSGSLFITMYSTDEMKAFIAVQIEKAYERGQEDEAVARTIEDLKAYDEGRKDGFETCIELHANGWLAEGRREERARILAALPDDDPFDLSLSQVRAIIEGK